MTTMQRWEIINNKMQGLSDRKVAGKLGVDRKTVRYYWDQYTQIQKALKTESDPYQRMILQEVITTGRRAGTGNHKRTACTPEAYSRVKSILKTEQEKDKLLGSHKQKLTIKQIHEILLDEGFVIGYTSVKTIVNDLRKKYPECFIVQNHPMGKRLEYDFGEAKLIIGGKRKRVYLAVFAAPASKFRWAYIYEKNNLEVFIDSHVRFFEKVGGVWEEVVYDNMKNVVSDFNFKQKKLNEEAVKLALYYGFRINTTNPRSGNEKGFVEGSVNYVRNQLFAKRFQFSSMDEVKKYVEEQLTNMNDDKKFFEEMLTLRVAPGPYRRYEARTCHVDHSSLIRINNNSYSVPDKYVGKDLVVRIYVDEILIYDEHDKLLLRYKKSTAPGKTINIRHYINTFMRKPGALCDSLALRSIPKLKFVYDTYYSRNPKRFIQLLKKNQHSPDDELAEELLRIGKLEDESINYEDERNKLRKQAYVITGKYNNLTIGRKENENK